MLETKTLGNKGEAIVAQWLESHGGTILARNYTTRAGEVDLIASKDDVVAFIEVKTRSVNYFPIAQVVTPSKQRKIIKAAQNFILANNIIDKVLRFDIATVIFDNNTHKISYIKNAFMRR